MAAKYLFRFDDICPTMNWAKWRRIEEIMAPADVKPILAVVPDNHDPKLMVDPPDPDFWEKVRKWQARGWGIAVHGYKHVYVNKNAGVMGLNSKSEFAGLSEEEQRSKLEPAVEIFRREGVRPDAWVAPSHSFDYTTVRILVSLGVNVVCDGLAFDTYTDSLGATWVPMQLCNALAARRGGVWGSSYHSNHWDEALFQQFAQDVKDYEPRLASLAEVVAASRERARTPVEHVYAKVTRACNTSSIRIARGIAEKVCEYVL